MPRCAPSGGGLRFLRHEPDAAGRDRMVLVPDLVAELRERTLVVVWHHLHELRGVPRGEHTRSDGRTGALCVLGDERTHELFVVCLERLECDELHVAAPGEPAIDIE